MRFGQSACDERTKSSHQGRSVRSLTHSQKLLSPRPLGHLPRQALAWLPLCISFLMGKM